MKDKLNSPWWKLKIVTPFIAGVVLGTGFEAATHVIETMLASQLFNDSLSIGYLIIPIAVLYTVVKVLSWLPRSFGFKEVEGEVSFSLVSIISLVLGSLTGYLFVNLIACSGRFF